MGYFSITRLTQGKSDVEKDKELGLQNTPPLTIYHCKRDIRIMPKKLIYMAHVVKWLPIEDAIAQMKFSGKIAGVYIKEVLEEAQKKAVEEYGVQDKKNLYVARTWVGRGNMLKKIDYKGRGRFGIMRLRYSHYFVELREGVPETVPRIKRKWSKMTELERVRRCPKTIKNSLSWF